jgi:hypothetical protein
MGKNRSGRNQVPVSPRIATKLRTAGTPGRGACLLKADVKTAMNGCLQLGGLLPVRFWAQIGKSGHWPDGKREPIISMVCPNAGKEIFSK